MNAGYARVSRKDQRLERRGAGRVALGAAMAVLPGVGLLSLVWLIGIYTILFGIALIVLALGTGVAEPRRPQGGLIPGKEATNDHATRQHQHDRERPYAFREPAGRTAARAGPREAKHHASQENLALVRAHTARELPRGQAPLPRPRSADPGALHLLQRRGPGGERRGDL